MAFGTASEWAEEQFGTLQLADKRLNKRALHLAAALAGHAGRSIPSAFAGDVAGQEGAYRFMSNERVAVEELIRAGGRGTLGRLPTNRTVLALCDSTTLDFYHPTVRLEMGDLGGPAKCKSRGLWVHSILAVDEETRIPLGLLYQDYWTRSTATRGKRHQRATRAYKDKESYKWEKGLLAANQLLNDTIESDRPELLYVCDREADVFQLFQAFSRENVPFVIRSGYERALDDGELLYDTIGELSEFGSRSVHVTARGGRPARTVSLSLRAGRVVIRPPGNLPAAQRVPQPVHIVVAEEVDAPSTEDALQWVLITSESVETYEDVQRIVSIYETRWLIEDFHKAWKTGCGVEKQRLQSTDSLLRIAVILAHTAVRLLNLR